MGKSEISIGDNGSALVSKLASNFTELYSASNVSDYIIQTTDNIALKTWWDEKVVNYNTFIIADDFDFNGASLTLPAGVSLFFNGGVWSNGTITGDNSNIIPSGLRQCFETTLTLAGKWNMAYITPQHYGAKSNANTGLTTNDCTASIQKILDTGFSVVIPNGLYYLTDSLIITKPVSVACSKSNIRYSSSVVSTQDHVRLYTDQNKPILIIRSGGFVWSGGVLDIRNAAAYNTGVIKFDLNYTYFYVDIKTAIHGNGTSIRDVAGYTPYGTYFACDEATAFKEIHDINIDTDCYYLQIANYVAPSDPEVNSLVSICNYVVNSWGCKQAQVIESGSAIHIDGWHESGKNLTQAESLLPVIHNKAESTTISGRFYDYMEALPYYSNAIFVITEAAYCRFVGDVYDDYYFNSHKYINRYSQYPITETNPNLVLLNAPSIISQLHNDWAFLTKRDPAVTINFYDGSGVDFETSIEPLTACSAATAFEANKSDFFTNRRCAVNFTSESTTDFIEIVIPVDLGGDYLQRLYYHITNITSFPFAIQTIIRDNDDVDKMSYWLSSDMYKDGSSTITPFILGQLSMMGVGLKRVIIRLIGALEIGVYWVTDIFAQYRATRFNGLLNIGGSQTIYGNLSISGGIPKLLSQATYADNAAAKADGLVAGDTYRTATGVLMVVYD